MKLVDNQLHVSKAELVSALKKLAQGQLLDATEGICDNLEDTLLLQAECNPDTRAAYNGTLLYLWMRDVATRWSKWSRDSTYPVPVPVPDAEHDHNAEHEGFVSARDAYWRIADKWEGAYGQLRLELVDFLIQELEKQKSHFVVFWGYETDQNLPKRAALDEWMFQFDTTTDHNLPEGWIFLLAEEPDDPLADLADCSILVTDTGLQLAAEYLSYASNGDVWIKHPSGFEYNLGQSIDLE